MLLSWTLLTGCDRVVDGLGDARDANDLREIVVEVPAGATARKLGPMLVEAGVVADAGRWEWWTRLRGAGGCLKAGRHRLSPSMDAERVMEVLCGPPLPEDIPFTVVEGWRIVEIDAALAEAGLTEPGEYASLASDPTKFHASFALPSGTLEGYLFPETYMITPDRFEPAGFIQRQLDTFAERFATPRADAVAARGLHAVVIMASMIEREEPTEAQRSLVAGILWKRIDHGWNLGVDATSRYRLDDWNDRKAFLENLRDPDEPYNTRLRPGLPPTPIGNPGVTALEAAVAPLESDYWYYLHDAERILRPSRNEAEHAAKRRQYGVW